jgi:hypothetical protein
MLNTHYLLIFIIRLFIEHLYLICTFDPEVQARYKFQ